MFRINDFRHHRPNPPPLGRNAAKKRKVSKSKPFVPENPFVGKIQGMFNDEETSDVLFEVITTEPDEDGSKRVKASTSFHAHRLIMQVCAPMLEALFEPTYLLSSDGKLTATITDIKPAVFHRLLWYVYGGRVPEEDLKTHAKDIIEAADKYNIVNLKLEAEAAYVESTAITAENAIDNLLYADAKNCALLKEAVFDFLTQNGEEVIARLSRHRTLRRSLEAYVCSLCCRVHANVEDFITLGSFIDTVLQ